jgi:hypothetical protein
MLSALVGLALTPVVYKIPDASPVLYNVQLGFTGYLPVLGGTDGSVEAHLQLTVQGLKADQPTQAKASTDLTDFKAKFNGANLPFTLDNVKQYFPKNTVTLTPQGKVLSNDAPDVQLDFRLPGLDVKRIPDITYLAVEFPEAGIEQGKSWTYTKAFGDSDVSYIVTPTLVNASEIDMDVKLSQTYETLEDEAKKIVKDPKDAAASVKTSVNGAGKVVFDRKLGLIKTVDITADAASHVTDLQSKAETDRNLQTKLVVNLQPPK